ncbi:hypothetical protein WICPIJ_008386 [Wickerhamomyces pijperi]|uniref:Sfi1 spindle body domain-containing protein n=1 Tax=Wickerhamomyces pijperi TaxID=599730 RepID=A0A9P8PXB9_WICPI|nr:hypothetical protein WICPIJ_008386 [Wickerhamomyces pijperi]
MSGQEGDFTVSSSTEDFLRSNFAQNPQTAAILSPTLTRTPFTGYSPIRETTTNVILRTDPKDVLNEPTGKVLMGRARNQTGLSSPFRPDTEEHISETTKFFQHINLRGPFPNLNPHQIIVEEEEEAEAEDYEYDDDDASAASDGAMDIGQLFHLVSTNIDIPEHKLSKFKGILRYYIDYLIETDVDLSSDPLVSYLAERLQDDDTERLAQVARVVDNILLSPKTLTEILANYLYHKNHRLKSMAISIWKDRQVEIRESRELANLNVKRKFLDRLFQKYDTIVEVYEPHAQKLHDRSLKSFSFDIWKKRREYIQSLETGVEIRIKQRTLQLWKTKIDIDLKSSEDQYATSLTKSTLKKWVLKLRLNQFENDKTGLSKLLLKRDLFTLWKSEYERVRLLHEDSKLFQLGMHAGYIFDKWKSQGLVSLERCTALEKLLSDHLKAKYLRIWTYMLNLKLTETEVLLTRDELLKRFILRKMKEKLQLETKLEIFERDHRQRTLSKYLQYWKKQSTLETKLREYLTDMKVTKIKYFKIWKLEQNLKSHARAKEAELVPLVFNQWKCSTILQIHQINFTTQRLIPKFYDKWLIKVQQNQEDRALAREASVFYRKTSFLNNWKSSLNQVTMLEKKTELMVKKKFFQRISKKFTKIQDLQLISGAHYETNSTILKGYFDRWANHYELNVESRLTNRLQEFNKSKESKIKNIMLQVWKEKYSVYILNTEDFLNLRRTYYLRKGMDQWKDRFKICQSMTTAAEEFNDLHLSHSAMTKIKSKFDYVIELEEVRLDYQDDRDYKLLQKVMNHWNLKVLKNQSYHPIVQNFQKRWERARLRGMFALWRNKSERIAEEIIEDDSPTKRNPILQTPMRNLSSALPFNVSATSTLPRHERNKLERMESLKNRYGQLKLAIPSPTSTFKNVSPAKRETQPVNLGNLPKPKLSFADLSRPLRGTRRRQQQQSPQTPSFDLDTDTLIANSEFDDEGDESEFGEDVDSLATPLLRRGRRILG